MDLEKTCRILGDLLAARLFELELVAKATFLTPFSPRELGNDIALILKGKEDRFEGECRQRDRTNSNASPFLGILLSPGIPVLNNAALKTTVRQYRINR